MEQAAIPPDDTPFNHASWRMVVAWLAIGALWRALLASLVPPLPDETYYWEWTRHLQLSYFDHPPAIALLIRAGTLVFGDTPAGIRAGPAIAGMIASVSMTLLANNLAGRGAALRAAMLSTVLPIATLGLVLATPDAPLMMTVSLALLALERALAAPLRSQQSLGWWLCVGVAVGAAMLTKYTAILMPLSFLLVALVHPALRRRFAEPGPWLAGVVALLVFAPVVVWNAHNNWISFRFQLNHGFGQFTHGTPLVRELEYVGAQVGLASPVLFVLLVMAIVQACRVAYESPRSSNAADDSPRRLALAATSVTAIVFFALSAWRRPVEANWPALMYPGALVLLAATTSSWARQRWWRASVAVAGAACAVATLQAWRPVLPFKPSKDPIARAYGWDALARSIDRARHDPSLANAPHVWLASTRYEVSSEIAFRLPEQPHVHCLWVDGRPNQYDLWPTFLNVAKPGDALVAAFDADAHGDEQAAIVGRWFEEQHVFETTALVRDTGVFRVRRVWLFRNARNIPSAAARLPATWDGR